MISKGKHILPGAVTHVDTGTGAAALASVEEDTESGPRDGLVKVCVCENNVGRLATELEGDLLEVGGSGSLHNVAADKGRASESNLVDVHVVGNGSAGSGSESRDDVHDTGGETFFLYVAPSRVPEDVSPLGVAPKTLPFTGQHSLCFFNEMFPRRS